MANTFHKLATITVGAGGASSIDFTSIPGTYTDLQIMASLRDNTGAVGKDYKIEFNSNTSSYTYRRMYGDGGAVNTDYASTSQALTIDSATSTAGTFSNCLIYIPNYAGSRSKSWSADTVTENNTTGTNSAYINFYVGMWNNSSAITSISLKPISGSPTIQQYSTVTLYGI